MSSLLIDIHPNATLGKNISVGNFSTIAADVIIGDGTQIGPHVTILSGSRIGKNCQIFPGAVIGATAQDQKKATTSSAYVTIGDHTIVREFVTLHRGTLGHTTIGAHVLLMAYVHVAHDCTIEDYTIIANGVQLAGHITLQHHCIIGGMTGIHQFTRIGSYSMVAGRSSVRKDVPPFVKVAREPLRYCGINTVALQRHGFIPEQYERIKQSYHLIYQSKLPLETALSTIAQEIENSAEKEMILSFIRDSKRGIVKKSPIHLT